MSMDKPQIENLELLVKTTTALQRTPKETTEREREREKSHRFLLLQHLLRHGYTIAHFPLFLSLQTKSPGPGSRPLPRRPPPPLHATDNLGSTKFSQNIERHESNSLSFFLARPLSLSLSVLRLFFTLLSTIQLRTSSVLFCHCRMRLSSAQFLKLDSKLESSLFLDVLVDSGMWNLLFILHSKLGGKPAF